MLSDKMEKLWNKFSDEEKKEIEERFKISRKDYLDQKTYRNLDDIEAEYFSNHPEEIDSYISEILNEHSKDGDTAALKASLRTISKL